MKKFLRFFCISIAALNATYSNAQCGAGYTSAQLNWDHVDYYWNSGGGAPYQNYVTDAMEMNQKFAFGPNYVTITLSANDMVNPSTSSPIYGSAENTSHTGESGSYGVGADVQFNISTTATRTITLTFNTEVKNLQFSLYDLDNSQRVTVTAKDALNAAQSVTLSKPSGGAVTIGGSPGTAPTGTGTGSYGNTVNTATLNIDIAGPVKTVVLSFDNAAGDFWLSDINACVTGTFPTNYQQTGNNQPLQGPAGNQPDYFIVTPDNQSVYMVDPATGNASLLFTDASQPFVNSFGYDPYNHILYYVTDATSSPSSNKSLKKYDFNTGTISTVVANITTTLGIPTFDQGVESAAAAFYDGALYLGIEGGRYSSSSSTRTRETIIWRIDFDASLNPTGAYQVVANDAYVNASNTSVHDYGDFIIKNGVLYDFNTARNGTSYSQSKFQQYDLMTGSETNYNNPGTTEWNGQAGMTWTGQLYYFRNTSSTTSGVGTYDGAGNLGALTNITVVDGSGAWPGGNGDASENFRPQVDFGDAPASYDPDPLSPASHAQDNNLKLGSNEDKEWVTRGQNIAADDNFDDGLAYTTNLVPNSGSYLTTVSVYNNTGANATVCAWLDYNGNGVFDASEGVSVTVPTSASAQNVDLFWPSISSSLLLQMHTYLRIRVTYASNGMTTANPTGYYNGGEVEDYRVFVSNTPLSVQYSDFDVRLTSSKTAKLSWSSSDESNVGYYTIEKSTDKNNWRLVDVVHSGMQAGPAKHQVIDRNVAEGTTYYRMKTIERNGKLSVSSIKQVENKTDELSVFITPNPAASKAIVHINSVDTEIGKLEIIGNSGAVVFKKDIHLNAGVNLIELPIANLASGSYIVNVITGTKTLHKSLIVNK